MHELLLCSVYKHEPTVNLYLLLVCAGERDQSFESSSVGQHSTWEKVLLYMSSAVYMMIGFI